MEAQQMATTKLSDEEFLAFLEKHPDLRDRFASIVGVVENSEGNLKEADNRADVVSGGADQVDVAIALDPLAHGLGPDARLAHPASREDDPIDPVAVRKPLLGAGPERPVVT